MVATISEADVLFLQTGACGQEIGVVVESLPSVGIEAGRWLRLGRHVHGH